MIDVARPDGGADQETSGVSQGPTLSIAYCQDATNLVDRDYTVNTTRANSGPEICFIT